MTASSKPKSIRVHLSIPPGTPAYVILAGCATLAARRSAAVSLMQVMASIVMAGLTGAQSSTSVRSSVIPAGTSVDSSRNKYSSGEMSPADAIFRIDFSDM